MNKLLFFYGGLLLLGGLMACSDSVEPAVGRVYNADRSFTKEIVPERQPLGMVFAMEVGPDSAYAYVVSLTECELPLSSDKGVLSGDTSTICWNGLANISLWRDSLSSSPVLSLLDTYGDGWFVPSIGEWRLLRDSFEVTNDRLARLSASEPLRQGQYWCSTAHAEPHYDYCGVAYDVYSNTYGLFDSGDSCAVRPMRRVLLKGSWLKKWIENKTF